MDFQKTYNTNYFCLNIDTDNKYIYESIHSYFSIYNNIKQTAKIPQNLSFFINVNSPPDILKNLNILNTSFKKIAEHKKRFIVYEISRAEYLVEFYNNFCKMIITFFPKNNTKIECYVEKPERCGIDFFPNFIIIAAIEIIFKFKHFFFIHSSLVTKNNIGILLPGNSGSGKTTLAFYLMSFGYKLISDDKVFAGFSNGKLYCRGVLQPVDIIKKKDKFLLNSGLLNSIMLESSETDSRIYIKQFNPNIIENKTQIKFIFFPKIGKAFCQRKISKNEALTMLMKSSITPNFNIALEKHFEVLNNLVEKSETYSIVVGNKLREFSNFIENILI